MGHVSAALRKFQAERAERSRQPGGPSRQPGEDGATPNLTCTLEQVAAAEGEDSYSPLLVVHHDRDGAIANEFRGLRMALFGQPPADRTCCAITSAEAGEGKTLTCVNLALVMAEFRDRRTLVIDCDAKGARAAALLNVPPAPGLSDVLAGACTLRDGVQPTQYSNLFVLPPGRPPDGNAEAFLGRPDVGEVIGQLARLYDHVLLDTPAVGCLSDAGAVSRHADEVLLVVRMQASRRKSVEAAVSRLRAAGVEPSGTILVGRRD